VLQLHFPVPDFPVLHVPFVHAGHAISMFFLKKKFNFYLFEFCRKKKKLVQLCPPELALHSLQSGPSKFPLQIHFPSPLIPSLHIP